MLTVIDVNERYYQAVLAVLVIGLGLLFWQNIMLQQDITALQEQMTQQPTEPADDTANMTRLPEQVDLDGPFVAQEGKGLMKAGSTALDSTIGYELSGPMEITFTAGTFVSPDGDTYELEEDETFTVEPGDEHTRVYTFHLVDAGDGTATVHKQWYATSTNASTDVNASANTPNTPSRDVLITLIGGWLEVAPGQTSLEDEEIPVFYVYDSERRADAG